MADVDSDIKDWSITASSNKPADATTIGSGLADNFQQIQATVKTAFSHKGSDIASATTTDLGATVGLYHDITGTTTITGFGTTAATGQWKLLQFDGALQITYNATSMILPGNANITTAAGDMCMVIHEGSGNWRMLWYTDDSMLPQLLDEDDMSSDSATQPASQQSIKAYVDSKHVLGTPVASTSGSTVDFTSIPAGVQYIDVVIEGLSTATTVSVLLRLGNSGGVEATGYVEGTFEDTTGSQAHYNNTTGFTMSPPDGSATVDGIISLRLLNSASFIWCCRGQLGHGTWSIFPCGTKTLSAELDRIQIFTSGTFDAGSVNVIYG